MGKAHSDQRDRTLSLIRLLYQESDEDHPFTTQQIVQRLTQAGISVERKSVYRDLAAMNQHGFPVAYRRGAGWYAAGQPFTLAELQGVVDAVAVYRGLPSALREVLLEKLTALAPQPQRRRLCRPVALEPRGGGPDRVRPVLDRIYAALQRQHALRFVPVTYNNQGTRCLGEACLVTPKGMLWSQERHQLLGWNHQTRKLTLYRPDRMHQVEVTDVPAQGPEADLSQWLAAPFGPDLRLQTTVCLRCRTGLAGGDPGPLGQGGHPGPGARRVYGDRPGGAGACLLGLAGRPGGRRSPCSPHLGCGGLETMVPSSGLWPGGGLETRGERCLVRG